MINEEGAPRQPLAGLAIAACLGVLGAEWLNPANPFLLAALLATLGATLCALGHRTAIPVLLLTCVGFGTLHAGGHFQGEARRLAQALAGERRAVIATGIVDSEPQPFAATGRGPAGRFRLRLESLAFGEDVCPTHAAVQVRWSGELPQYGDRVSVLGSIAPLQRPRNPGQFDFRAYQQRTGVFSEISAKYPSDCRILSHGHGNALVAWSLRSREWIKGRISLGIEDSPEQIQLISSMVLGMRSETPDEVRQLFQHTGTLHLFAVSGLNVAMIAYLAGWFLKPFGMPRRLRVLLLIPVVAGYALITGLSPSCVRAAIMAIFILGAVLADRPAALHNSLGGAALFILACDTNQLFTAGFQFSFALVITLVWFAHRMERRLLSLGSPDPFLPRPLWSWRLQVGSVCWRQTASAIAVTVTAWLGSAGFTAAYFHLFSPSALVANLFTVPLAFGILALGLLTTIAGALVPLAAALFNNANWLCCHGLMWIITHSAALPAGYMYVAPPASLSTGDCEFAVLDLEDGAAIHLRTEAGDWLIDCGHVRPNQHIVEPYLRSRGIDTLSGVVITHGDAQHIGGALRLQEQFRPAIWADSVLRDRSPTRRALHRLLEEQGKPKRLLQQGDRLRLSPGVTLEVLYPPAGLRRSLADDKALVLRLVSPHGRVLFMSDAGYPTEEWLLEHEPDLRADLLVKGWHSRDLSGTDAFLSRVQPQAIIAGSISFAGKRERLEEWSAHLRRSGFPLFRQDETGAVLGRLSPAGLQLTPHLAPEQHWSAPAASQAVTPFAAASD